MASGIAVSHLVAIVAMHLYAWGLGRDVAEIPDVELMPKAVRMNYGYKLRWKVVCNADDCGVVDTGDSVPEAESIKYDHISWHEEGMPD